MKTSTTRRAARPAAVLAVALTTCLAATAAATAHAVKNPAGTGDAWGAFTSFVSILGTPTVEVSTTCYPAPGAKFANGGLEWGDGLSQAVPAHTKDLRHTYDHPGTYKLRLTCTDTASHTWRGTFVLTVSGPSGGPDVGKTIPLGRRTKTSGCKQHALPDRRCSPGAYSSGLTKSVICASTFRPSALNQVAGATKRAVERAYGVRAGESAVKIDHVVPLALGGANTIANLFPQSSPGHVNYRAKNQLEKQLHTLVCTGRMTLSFAQRRIALDWQRLYRRVFKKTPA